MPKLPRVHELVQEPTLLDALRDAERDLAGAWDRTTGCDGDPQSMAVTRAVGGLYFARAEAHAAGMEECWLAPETVAALRSLPGSGAGFLALEDGLYLVARDLAATKGK